MLRSPDAEPSGELRAGDADASSARSAEKASAMESIAGISVHGLSVRYETRAEEVVALKHVSVDLHPGEFVAIHGVSGSGKTTLLAVLGGLLRAVDGQVHSFGTELSKIDDNGLAEYRRTIAGTVFQEYNLISSLRAIENVAMPLVLNGMTMAAAKGVARLSLDRLHIADLAARFPGELSGGQRQRLAIARALSADKPLLLVDEPTGALDTATANAVVAELQEVARAGTLVVAATHDPHVRDQADRVLHLVDGQLA